MSSRGFDEYGHYGENNPPVSASDHIAKRGLEALDAAIIEALGEDAPANAMIQWGTVMGGAVLRIDLIDPHAGLYVAAVFIHETDATPRTIAAGLRPSIYMTRGEFGPEDGFTG